MAFASPESSSSLARPTSALLTSPTLLSSSILSSASMPHWQQHSLQPSQIPLVQSSSLPIETPRLALLPLSPSYIASLQSADGTASKPTAHSPTVLNLNNPTPPPSPSSNPLQGFASSRGSTSYRLESWLSSFIEDYPEAAVTFEQLSAGTCHSLLWAISRRSIKETASTAGSISSLGNGHAMDDFTSFSSMDAESDSLADAVSVGDLSSPWSSSACAIDIPSRGPKVRSPIEQSCIGFLGLKFGDLQPMDSLLDSSSPRLGSYSSEGLKWGHSIYSHSAEPHYQGRRHSSTRLQNISTDVFARDTSIPSPQTTPPQLVVFLDPQHCGQGYATEAVRAALLHVFQRRGPTGVPASVQSVIDSTSSCQTQAQQVLERLGFQEELPSSAATSPVLSARMFSSYCEDDFSAYNGSLQTLSRPAFTLWEVKREAFLDLWSG
ncbi:hypothetical protein DFJ73DRAFT_811668 [Zopfochytrium polystomum]|nr:hypothetical protein DFJ73DRAFT_811668 [Zopfochytrium polystomum]